MRIALRLLSTEQRQRAIITRQVFREFGISTSRVHSTAEGLGPLLMRHRAIQSNAAASAQPERRAPASATFWISLTPRSIKTVAWWLAMLTVASVPVCRVLRIH